MGSSLVANAPRFLNMINNNNKKERSTSPAEKIKGWKVMYVYYSYKLLSTNYQNLQKDTNLGTKIRTTIQLNVTIFIAIIPVK